MTESVVVDLTVPAESFLLAETMASAPGLVLEAEPFVISEADLFPYLWVRNLDDVDFGACTEDEPTMASVRRLAVFGDEALYRTTWCADDGGLVGPLRAEATAVLQASGRGGSWEMKLRFDGGEALSAFYDASEEGSFGVDVRRVNPDEDVRASQFSLTASQREALVVAHEMGYFEVPRRATAEEVGARLGISGVALSQRLRRATTNLITNAITIGEPTALGDERQQESV